MRKGLSERSIKLLLYAVVIILINAAGLSLYTRVDLTESNRYSLSDLSKEAVGSLSEPLTIKGYFSQDLPPPYNNIKRYLRDLLQEYAVHANKNFNYTIHEIGPQDEETKQQAREAGINPVQVQVVQKDEVQYKNGYMGLVMLHGDAVEKLPTITSTKHLEYQLTSSIQKLQNKVSALLGLEGKVDVRLYLSESLKKIAPYIGVERLAELPSKIETMVRELNAKNYSKLRFEHIDPSDQGNKADPASAYELQQLEWPDLPDAGIQSGRGTIGLVLEYQDRSTSLNLLDIVRLPLLGTQYSLTEPQRLKESINQNLQSLLGINQTLGYLADHGTLPLSRAAQARNRNAPSTSAFQDLVSQTYTLKEVSLEEGIPEGLGCLVIAGASKEFSDYELFLLDQALMRGTNLAVFQDGVRPQNAQQRQMGPQRFEPNNNGLNKLLNHYGLQVNASVVLDEHCYEQQISRQRGGGQQPIYFAPIIKNKNINHELPFMKNIKGLVAFKSSPLQTNSQRLEAQDIQAHRLFSSSDKSWLMSERIHFNPMRIAPPGSAGEQQSYPLAYLLSGRFRSFFADKPIPEKETEAQNATGKEANAPSAVSADQEITAAFSRLKESQQPGKVFLLGSSDMLTDTILEAQGQSPNSIFTMNVIDALNDRLKMAELRAKVQEFNPLQETDAQTKTVVKMFNIVGLPILVIIFGLFVWWGRNRRKQKIKEQFQQ